MTSSISESKLASPALLSDALNSIANAIFITDTSGCIVWCNDAFTELSGYPREELIGKKSAVIKSGMQSNEFYSGLWHTIHHGRVWRGILINRKKDGTLYSADETITPLINRSGVIEYFIALQQDVTLQNKEHDREHFLAFHDSLTSLPNRTMFCDLVLHAILEAKNSGQRVAVYFIDLDNFKPVNDTYGHWVGDQLLCHVARRLCSVVRKSDTVARLGGDEYTALVTGFVEKEVAVNLSRKFVDCLCTPFVIDNKEIRIGASIGLAFYPDDAKDAQDLLDKADQAMYAAKKEGGNISWLYETFASGRHY